MNKPKKVLEIDKVTREVVRTFESCNQAARHLQFDYSMVSYHCTHGTLPPGDTYIRFESEFDPNERFREKIKYRPVVATHDGKARAFHNVEEAAKAVGVSIESMTCYAGRNRTINGITWRYLSTKWPESAKDGTAWA